MTVYAHLSDLQPLVGQEIGVSEWVTVDQARIDAFAHATEDLQWIHVDSRRAAEGGDPDDEGLISRFWKAPAAPRPGTVPAPPPRPEAERD